MIGLMILLQLLGVLFQWLILHKDLSTLTPDQRTKLARVLYRCRRVEQALAAAGVQEEEPPSEAEALPLEGELELPL